VGSDFCPGWSNPQPPPGKSSTAAVRAPEKSCALRAFHVTRDYMPPYEREPVFWRRPSRSRALRRETNTPAAEQQSVPTHRHMPALRQQAVKLICSPAGSTALSLRANTSIRRFTGVHRPTRSVFCCQHSGRRYATPHDRPISAVYPYRSMPHFPQRDTPTLPSIPSRPA